MTANGDAPTVVVIGGGVSGLATAYRLTKAAPSIDVVVLEANDRPGGKLRSVQVGDLMLPSGADSFLARKPWAVQLCKELGIGDELVAPCAAGAHLWTERGLVAMPKQAPFGIPGDIGQVFSWPGLSGAGRRRGVQPSRAGRVLPDHRPGGSAQRAGGRDDAEWRHRDR